MLEETNQLQTKIDSKNSELINQIVDQDDSKQVTDLVNLFNLNHMKKQMIRTMTYDQLLDNIMNQVTERVTKRGDQFSNKDLLDYMNAMGNAMDKAQKQIGDIQAMPAIQINQQNNIVNVSGDSGCELDRESRKRVMNAVSSILEKLKNNQQELQVQEDELVYVDDNNIALTESEDFEELNEEEN